MILNYILTLDVISHRMMADTDENIDEYIETSLNYCYRSTHQLEV